MRTSILLLGLMLASCSHIKAEDHTVAEHRNEAAIHLENAKEEQAQYDPSKTMRPAPRGPGSAMFAPTDVAFEPYNPSDAHMQAADRELVQANAHLSAAKSLLAFEDKACVGLSDGERSSCPLFATSVRRVEWMQEGFKLSFKQPIDATQNYARLRCHLAYAVATGFDRPSCPLFVKGTTLRQEGADAVVFAGDSAEVSRELRAQARRLFPSVPTSPVSSR